VDEHGTMPADPTARVLQLLSLLQTYRFWPGAELADRLEVSQRTLRRDVDRLRELGYAVDASRGVAGGYRLAAGNHLPPLVLDDEEAVAIAVGLRTAAGASVEGIEDTSVRALAKLEQVLPNHLRRRVNAVHANVTPMRWGGDGPRVDPEALAVLAQGCRDHEQVRFEYQRRDGDETRRLVEPHQLVSAGRRWYLVAWDVRRGDWRTFRVDRLSEPALAGARFSPRELPAADAAEFVQRSIVSMPAAHEAIVEVRAPVDEVREAMRWLEGELLDPSADGRCRVRLRNEQLAWLAPAVAMIAARFDVSLVEPDELRVHLAALGGRLAAC
jgi:predicted DNA-binding transcriptional regulator YafY